MSDKWNTEKVYEIWNDDSGYHYEVGQDRDGLDLVEIRSYGPDENDPDARFTMQPEVAVEVARLITKEYGAPTPSTDALIAGINQARELLEKRVNETAGQDEAVYKAWIILNKIDTGSKS